MQIHRFKKYYSLTNGTKQNKNKNKSQTELTASVLKKRKKRSKTQKSLKERFLIGRNRTKRANFRRSPLFQATYNPCRTGELTTRQQRASPTLYQLSYTPDPRTTVADLEQLFSSLVTIGILVKFIACKHRRP